MKKLAIAAIVVAALAVVTSGAALWRTRDLTKSTKTDSTASLSGTSTPTDPNAPPVDVPDTTNQNVYAAAQALAALKLKYKLVRTPSATIAERAVISQTPAPGTKVPAGTEVELTISSGPPPP